MKYVVSAIAAVGLLATPVIAAASTNSVLGSAAQSNIMKLADDRDIGHKKGDKGKGVTLSDRRDTGHKKGDKGKQDTGKGMTLAKASEA